MFEKLIVAFDGTDTGWDGLVLSMGLAKALGSRVAVVYVYDEELAASSRTFDQFLCAAGDLPGPRSTPAGTERGG